MTENRPRDASRPIAMLPNLGPRSAAMLAEIGIETERDLKAIGAAQAFRRVRHAFPKQASRNLLWALQGAIEGRPWTSFDRDEKARLKSEAGI